MMYTSYIDTSHIDTSSIPPFTGVFEVEHEEGNTRDIINVLLEVDRENDERFKKFASQFPPNRGGLFLLWAWLRNNITYVEDGFGYQYIKYPNALWGIGRGDCKSLTVFVNQILKLIGLSYYTRFTGYLGGEFRHVYTVVLLNGEKIPLDTVHDYFGEEVPYTKKEDHMTTIATIRGVPKPKRNSAVGNIPTSLKEVQQRQDYIPDQAPVDFHKLTLSEAHLQLFKNRLQIFGAMRDMENTIQESLNMVDYALKNGRLKDGIIKDELQAVAGQLNLLLSLKGQSMGHGAVGQRKAFLANKANVLADRGQIGAFIPLKDLGSLWFEVVGGTGAITDPYQYLPLVQLLPGGLPNPHKIRTSVDIARQQNAIFFWGRNNNDYRITLREFWNGFQQVKSDFIAAHPGKMVQAVPNSERYNFANEATYKLFLEELKENSGVLSKWVNNLFSKKKQSPGVAERPNPAAGVLYKFMQDVQGVNYQDFPEKARFKAVFQQAYFAACANFSGVDPSLLEALIINGIMEEMGGHDPKTILKALQSGYTNQISTDPATLTAIVTIVVTLLSTTGTIIAAAMNDGADQAGTIDQSAKDTAQFANQNSSTIPEDIDFAPQVNNPGGGSGSGTGGNGGTGGGSGGGGNDEEGMSAFSKLLLGSTGLYLAFGRGNQS